MGDGAVDTSSESRSARSKPAIRFGSADPRSPLTGTQQTASAARASRWLISSAALSANIPSKIATDRPR